jgi:nucleotide-binding universal stress UspA family protein
MKELNDIILVPTDFSETCQNAINHGAELAEYLDYKLTIFHVINQQTKSNLKKEKLEISAITERLEDIANNIRERTRLQVDTLTCEGSIFDQIHQTARDLGAKLMVLGTHGKKGLQYLVGSYALKVVTKTPVPTIVVQKRGFGKGYKKIVFPINSFTEARQQVRWAIHMARTFGSEIFIYRQPQANEDLSKKIRVVSAQIEKAFDKYKVRYFIMDAEKTKNFAEQMINYAATVHADLIMIMTDADVFSQDFNADAWDQKMMYNEAQIPVMCINPIMTGKVYHEFITLI